MSKINGFQAALEALRTLDEAAQERILADILKKDPDMAKRLKSHLITFDDLLRVNPAGLHLLFQSVSEVKWVLALRGKSADFVDTLLKILPTRRIDLFKAALARLGPQPLNKVEAAQRDVLQKALELEAEGRLLFSKPGDPLV